MTVFDVFQSESYEFLEIARGTAAGDKIISVTLATGVFKLRTGMNSGTEETRQTDATLHIRPSESFVDDLVGNGIRIRGKT